MVPVLADAHLILLAQLDIVDVRADGTLVLNREFVMECRAAFDADSSTLDTVIGAHILKRALRHEMVVDLDLAAITLAALEIGALDLGAQ